MKAEAARELGRRIAALLEAGESARAYALLSPVLAERTSFDLLRRVGVPAGAGPLEPANDLLERIAAGRAEGGWVVIGSVLDRQLERDLPGALARCRAYIIVADVWYAADTLGEGVVGQALVRHFRPALDQLIPWREDANGWVRRAVGTAVHFWAKRSRGAAELANRARSLLAFLEPMFEEREIAAVKGVGWGLKTLGRQYPDLVAEWLGEVIVPAKRRHRALMLRKALTYLTDDQRARATGTEPARFSVEGARSPARSDVVAEKHWLSADKEETGRREIGLGGKPATPDH